MPEESIKIYIIDASFMLAYLLPDENLESVNALFDLYWKNKIRLFSSPIFSTEVLNGIRYSFVRKRINKKIALGLVDNFLDLKITTIDIDLKKVFILSMKKNLSVYDTSYIWLAKNHNTNLLTLDKKLAKIATK